MFQRPVSVRTTSVSMAISGPAPGILAVYFNTALDQRIEKFKQQNGREPTEDKAQKVCQWTLSAVRGTVQADILKEDHSRTPASSRPNLRSR